MDLCGHDELNNFLAGETASTYEQRRKWDNEYSVDKVHKLASRSFGPLNH
jgi:hypothetical protein